MSDLLEGATLSARIQLAVRHDARNRRFDLSTFSLTSGFWATAHLTNPLVHATAGGCMFLFVYFLFIFILLFFMSHHLTTAGVGSVYVSLLSCFLRLRSVIWMRLSLIIYILVFY